MGGALKTSARLLLVGAIGLLMGLLAQDAAIKNANPPTAWEIRQADNNSTALLIRQQAKVIKKSRTSTVRVLSTSSDAMISSQTGTYVTIFGRYFVVTTAHGILGDCENTKVLVEEMQFSDCTRFIELNRQIDYLLMEIKEIANLKAISIPRDLPSSRHEWLEDLSVMNRIFYTGYPNSIGPLTIDGHIAGYTSDDFIYLNSYAWSGSSGSGVFSQSGNYIGYILAIDVGGSPYGFPQVLEDIVLVVPAFKIDWAAALDVPDTAEEVPEGEDTAN
jgi:hypothetical protein